MLLVGDARIGRRHRRTADRGQTDRRQRGDDTQADTRAHPSCSLGHHFRFPPDVVAQTWQRCGTAGVRSGQRRRVPRRQNDQRSSAIARVIDSGPRRTRSGGTRAITSLVTNQASRCGVGRGARSPSSAASSSWRSDQIGEVLRRVRHLVREQLVETPVLGGDEPRPDAVLAVAADRAHGLGDVEVQPRDRIRQRRGRLLVVGAALGDQVLEDREQQLILARRRAGRRSAARRRPPSPAPGS